ncbi:MAG TPA: spore cortex-lytic enzyme [Firmicutes bacterium]|nr:spore cortex-lytic enzyme [Bacillota bacterium]
MLTKQRINGRGVLALALILLLIAASLLAVGAGKVAAAGELLRYGSRGESVRQVQSRLNGLGYWCGTADGIFGVNTRSAVRRFQSAKGLSVDGIVGPKTYSALGISSSSSSSSGGYSSSDLYLLARCVYGESRGEPYVGQVAVAAVVLNRVKSAAFPNSISGVIYQPYAFTCVSDGQLYLEPDQSAYNAARDAMNGWDPTNGCLYYYNPATATSAWIWSRPIMLQIGRHNFCK